MDIAKFHYRRDDPWEHLGDADKIRIQIDGPDGELREVQILRLGPGVMRIRVADTLTLQPNGPNAIDLAVTDAFHDDIALGESGAGLRVVEIRDRLVKVCP